jgi:hypothetical protein
MTRSRLQTWLPSVQVLLAAVLLTSNYLRRIDTPHDPSWTALDRQFCDGLNAPVALVKYLLLRIVYRELPYPYGDWAGLILETVVYLALVGLLWYVVAREIASGPRGRSKTGNTTKTSARPITDVLLIAFGITLAIATVALHAGGGTYYGLFGILHLLWAAVIVTFYGYDLCFSFRKTGPVK